jgi:selenocysteine lyase/cysteine desulfurase
VARRSGSWLGPARRENSVRDREKIALLAQVVGLRLSARQIETPGNHQRGRLAPPHPTSQLQQAQATLPPLDPEMAALRAREFSRLDECGQVYLDYTGSALFPASLVRRHTDFLTSCVLGNPHSRNPTSRASTELIEDARRAVLAHFEADEAEYELVFTLNASCALKLVGESFPFTAGSRLLLTADNHNSCHGLREFARAGDAELRYVPLGPELRIAEIGPHLEGASPEVAHLFVYPAQSNFSGVKHPLSWVEEAQEAGYRVLLDAAAFAPTSRLSLREVRPDFTCISFYKMFGYPTGVGALIARREALAALQRPWFGGGTVRFVSASGGVHLLHDTGRGFEDGTPNFLDIAAVPPGLDFLAGLGAERIERHVGAMTGHLLRRLDALRHRGGSPLTRIYGPRGLEGRGGAVAFNLVHPDGGEVDFRTVEERANAAGISLRTGFFCNPGAAEYAFDHREADTERCFRSLAPEDFSIRAFSICLDDRPVGAVRVSVGIPTIPSDIDALIDVLAGFRE